MTEKSNEDRGDLRSCVVGQTKEREQDRQPMSALIAFAGEQQFEVPRERIFEDDG
jgi:hypothetical protein